MNSSSLYNLGLDYYHGLASLDIDKNKAFALFKQAAELGYSDAMYYLAGMYEDGEGCDVNLNEALKWYQRGVEVGNLDCICILASSYLEGDIVEKDEQKAFDLFLQGAKLGDPDCQCSSGCIYDEKEDYKQALYWYQKAIANGDKGAMRNMAYMYLNGNGAEKDEQKALKLFLQGAELGDSICQYEVGRVYDINNDYKNALYWYQKTLENGEDEDAMCNLAYMYLDGNGVEKDEQKALELFLKAAKGDQSDAQYEVGRLFFLKGQLNEALFWYEKAADNGDTDAMYSLAYMFLNGEGGKQDNEKALSLFHKGAKLGSDKCQNTLGIMCKKNGDFEGAMLWYEKSIASNDKYAWNLLGELYCYELNDFDLAIDYFNKAIELNILVSYNHLSHIYLEHRKDYKLGHKILRKGAELGNAACQYNLALYLDLGLHGVKVDKKKAIKWYRKAIDQGDGMAMNNLALLLVEKPTKENLNEAKKLLTNAIELGNELADESLKEVTAIKVIDS